MPPGVSSWPPECDALTTQQYIQATRSERNSQQGRPFRFTARNHTELVDAFSRITQDRKNGIVILTGAGGEFILEIDFQISAA